MAPNGVYEDLQRDDGSQSHELSVGLVDTPSRYPREGALFFDDKQKTLYGPFPIKYGRSELRATGREDPGFNPFEWGDYAGNRKRTPYRFNYNVTHHSEGISGTSSKQVAQKWMGSIEYGRTRSAEGFLLLKWAKS